MSGNITGTQSRLLFGAMLANGVFSAVSGLIMLLFSGPIASRIGLAEPAWLIGTGVVLLLFGARLIRLGRSGSVQRSEAIAISAMDLAWVVGTVALALAVPGLFNVTGVWVVIAIAAVVLTFFDCQAYALWKTRLLGTDPN